MRTFLKTALSAVFAIGLATAAQADLAPLEIEGATTVDADGVIELIERHPTLVILDNRNQVDFDAGRIEGAVRLIDTDINGEADLAAVVPTKDTPILFYCNGLRCGRAANAVVKAVSYGYGNVYYYALGMEEWREKSLPLVAW